jgi:hypothetical protein
VEGTEDGVDGVKNPLRVSELDLGLCRMDIHIHGGRGKSDPE